MTKNIIIYLIIFLSSNIVLAQNTITGTVTDDGGQPLPGVSVLIKDTDTGTITNFDGEFTLNIKGSNIILVFMYTGMKSKEILYKGQDKLEVTLEEKMNRLNEVVVIGYQEIKKRDVTGSLNSINDTVINVNKTPNLFDAIQGRLAGVNVVSSSGEPGSAVNFNIRGSNSVFSAGSPLFIIDGVQIDISEDEVASSGVGSVAPMNPLATINPQDIKSIEVLKDASATAIYGSRGANGVIIVTTKGGEEGKLKFEFTSSIGFAEATKTIDVISPDEYLIYREARDPGNNFTNLEDGTPRDFSSISSRNWQDEVLRTAVFHNHNITASGGSKNTNYSASLGILDQEALIIQNDYERYNFRIKANHKQSEKLKFGFTLNSSYSETEGVANSGGGGDEFNGVVQFLVIANPWELADLTQQEETSTEFVSPISLINEGEKKLRFNRTFGSFFGSYDITDHITFRSQIGANFGGSKLQEFHSSDSRFGWRWNGRAILRQVESQSYNFANTLRYSNTFNRKHFVNVLVGFETASYNREMFFNDIIDFDNQQVGFNDISIGQVFKDYGSLRVFSNRMSLFSRIRYTLKGKYLFTGNFRADGSDRLGLNNRWGYFPGAAFAWRAHREKFLRKVSQINELKLRISYGQTGNERIPPFSYAARLNNAFYADNDGLDFGLAPGSLENQDLKWETTTQFNIGLDVSLFSDKISFTVDYYDKITEDMLIDTPIAGQTGFNSQWQNIGSLRNRGIEFSISTLNVNTPNFRWSTDFNISRNVNEVTDLGTLEFIPVTTPGGWIRNPGRVVVGEPIGTMYGFVFDGIHQVGNPEGAEPGTIKYKDLNGDGIIDDENDRTIIGNSIPDHVGGINNTFSYKNLSLSVFFQWSYGNDIFNAAKLRTNGFQPFMNITREYFENAWTEENASNIAPAFGKVEPVSSSYFVEDGSFLRLKTINLSYDLPKKYFTNSPLSSMRLFISGNNLLTFTNYSGFDPEVSFRNPLLRGFERFSYPRNRSIILGLNVKF